MFSVFQRPFRYVNYNMNLDLQKHGEWGNVVCRQERKRVKQILKDPENVVGLYVFKESITCHLHHTGAILFDQ